MEDTDVSPVKVYQQRLDIKLYNCLICGNRSGNNEALRNPGVKGISTFISSLEVRGNCDGFSTNAYAMFDFPDKSLKESLKEGVVDFRWHPKCYSSFTNTKHLGHLDTAAGIDENVEILPGTRSQKPIIDIQNSSMFCGFKKHKNDTKLILLQYEHAISRIKTICEAERDNEFKRRIGGSFDNLPALDAKYHHACYNKYIAKEVKSSLIQTTVHVHDAVFNMLLDEINPQLEGRSLELPNLQILKEKDYEHFQSYTTQKLKSRLMRHFGSRVIFTESTNIAQAMYSRDISISDVINTAAKYKQLVKDNDLINVVETESKLLDREANILLRDIKKSEGISINLLNPADILSTVVKNVVPESLKTFLSHLCNEKNNKGEKGFIPNYYW